MNNSICIDCHLFDLLTVQFLQHMVGAYKKSKSTCTRTWRSKRGGGLFSGGYGMYLSGS